MHGRSKTTDSLLKLLYSSKPKIKKKTCTKNKHILEDEERRVDGGVRGGGGEEEMREERELGINKNWVGEFETEGIIFWGNDREIENWSV